MHILVIIFLLTPIATALSVSRFGSHLERERKLKTGNATEENTQFVEFKTLNDSTVFTSGFLRTDTFDKSTSDWIQAEVQPIGVCFKEGATGGSVQISQVTMNDTSVLIVSNIYNSFDCSGDSLAVLHLQSLVELVNQLMTRIAHVKELSLALELIPASSNGFIITSYYTSEGCVGAPAKYDLVSDACAMRNDALGAFSKFWCDTDAQAMLFTKHGPHEDTYPLCEPPGNKADITKQPFQCSDQSVNEDGMDTFPVHQTVECVFGDVTWEQVMYWKERGGAADW